MFISKVFDWSRCSLWDYHIRQAHEAKDSGYTYIQKPCSWTGRLGALAQAIIMSLGALFSQRMRWATHESFLKFYLGYRFDITRKNMDLLFPEEAFYRGPGEEAISLDELQGLFLKSSEASLQLMAHIGPGLEHRCPILAQYLESHAHTAGQRLSLYLKLVEIISYQQFWQSKIHPEFIESYLKNFYPLRQELSMPGWQVRATDETGKLIACVSAAEFAGSTDLCDQLNTYRRLIYMQGFLDLVLHNCPKVPQALWSLNQLQVVTIRDSEHWPAQISKLRALQRINLVNCQLTSCRSVEGTVESLDDLRELRFVDIKGHRAHQVPVSLCQHPLLETVVIEGAITEVPVPGTEVESYLVQPNSRGVPVPDLKTCEKLKWFHWPFALIEEMRKAEAERRLPMGCRVSYL
jgi:hypothetical protein